MKNDETPDPLTTSAVLELLANGTISINLECGDLKLLSPRKTADKKGESVATLYRSVKQGTFPPPISVGPTMKRWPSTVVDDWILEQIRKDRLRQLSAAGSKGGRAKAENTKGKISNCTTEVDEGLASKSQEREPEAPVSTAQLGEGKSSKIIDG